MSTPVAASTPSRGNKGNAAKLYAKALTNSANKKSKSSPKKSSGTTTILPDSKMEVKEEDEIKPLYHNPNPSRVRRAHTTTDVHGGAVKRVEAKAKTGAAIPPPTSYESTRPSGRSKPKDVASTLPSPRVTSARAKILNAGMEIETPQSVGAKLTVAQKAEVEKRRVGRAAPGVASRPSVDGFRSSEPISVNQNKLPQASKLGGKPVQTRNKPKALANDVAIPERRQTQPTRLRVQPRGADGTITSFQDQSKMKCDNQKDQSKQEDIKDTQSEKDIKDDNIKKDSNDDQSKENIKDAQSKKKDIKDTMQKTDGVKEKEAASTSQVNDSKTKATKVNTLTSSDSDDETAESLFAKKMSNQLNKSAEEKESGAKADSKAKATKLNTSTSSDSGDETAESLFAKKMSNQISKSSEGKESGTKTVDTSQVTDSKAKATKLNTSTSSDSEDETAESLFAKKMANQMSKPSPGGDIGATAASSSRKENVTSDSDSSSDDEDAEALLAQKSAKLSQLINSKEDKSGESLKKNADPAPDIVAQLSLSDSDSSDDEATEELMAKKMNAAHNKEASDRTKAATASPNIKSGNDEYKEDNGSCDSRAEVRSSLDIDLDLSDNDGDENQQNEISQKADDKKSNTEVEGKSPEKETVEEIRKFMKSQE